MSTIQIARPSLHSPSVTLCVLPDGTSVCVTLSPKSLFQMPSLEPLEKFVVVVVVGGRVVV